MSAESGSDVSVRLVRLNGTSTPVSSMSAPLALSPVDRWISIEVGINEAAGLIHVVADGVALPDISLPNDFVLVDPVLSVGPRCTSGALSMLTDDVVVHLDR